MAIEKPTWIYKSKGDKQTASEMNQLAQSVIINATELSNIKDDVAELSNKTYNPVEYSGMGRATLRKNIVNGVNLLTQEMIDQENTIYIIQYDYNLSNQTITIPSGCVLLFEGGSLSNGTLKLSNNITIKGKGKISANYLPDNILYGERKCNSLILGINVNNINIEGIEFNIEGIPDRTDRTLITQSIIIYAHNDISSNINIQNCTFKGDGVSLFCNTQDVAIDSCTFIDCITNSIAFESLYDFEPYIGPKGLSFTNCIIDTHVNSDESANIWISGSEEVSILNNTIRTNGDSIALYCGDGNIKLNGVSVLNNNITTYKHASTKIGIGITVTGKSFVFPVSSKQFANNIIVSNNILTSEYDNYTNGELSCFGISCRWVKDIIISNNIIKGYGYGISSSDAFRGEYFRESSLFIDGNLIENTANQPIFFDTCIEESNITRNTFKNYCILPTIYNNRFAFILNKKRNIKVNDNLFINDNTNPVSLCDGRYSVNCRFLNNINKSTSAYSTLSTTDSSFRATGICESIGNNKILYKQSAFTNGSFEVGDIVNIANNAIDSGNRFILSYIVTKAGTQDVAPNTSFTGNSGTNIIIPASASNNVKCGAYLVFSDNIYRIIDIDYNANKYLLDKDLIDNVNTTPTYSTPNKEYYESYNNSETGNIQAKPLTNSDGTLASKVVIV